MSAPGGPSTDQLGVLRPQPRRVLVIQLPRAGMRRRHSGFQVSAERRIEAGDREGLESLLRYMERAPVSMERLEARSDGMVLYRGNYHPGLGTDHRLVTGVEFLALMVPHALLRYQVTSRGYGAASTRIRKRLGWTGRCAGEEEPPAVAAVTVLEEEESGFVKVRRRNWARLIAKVYLEDPQVCPRCGTGMEGPRRHFLSSSGRGDREDPRGA